jgi:hypothetical protein
VIAYYFAGQVLSLWLIVEDIFCFMVKHGKKFAPLVFVNTKNLVLLIGGSLEGRAGFLARSTPKL